MSWTGARPDRRWCCTRCIVSTTGCARPTGTCGGTSGRLYDEVRRGLRTLGREFPTVESIGIDTWAVDYGLVDADGTLLADPIAYRDSRTDAAVGRVHELVGVDELYDINGLQHLPFTTLYQLNAEREGPLWERAAHALLLPDLLAYWLTGTMRTEYTNASTTGLVDVRRREWSTALFDRLGIPPALFPPLEQPGHDPGHRSRRTSPATSTCRRPSS